MLLSCCAAPLPLRPINESRDIGAHYPMLQRPATVI